MPITPFVFIFNLLYFTPMWIRNRDALTEHEIEPDLSATDLEGQRDAIADEFIVSDQEQMDRTNHLPHWLADDDLKNSETETLPAAEEQFWIDLIQKYLEPIEPTDEEKVLPNLYSSIYYMKLVDYRLLIRPFHCRNKSVKTYARYVMLSYSHS